MSNYVTTIQQLVSEVEASDADTEKIDRWIIFPITNPNAFLYPLKTWASIGFPAGSSVMMLSLNAPTGGRSFHDYVSYLLSIDISNHVRELNTHFLGIELSYVLSGNTVQVLATRT
jgi:hypothetical protein